MTWQRTKRTTTIRYRLVDFEIRTVPAGVDANWLRGYAVCRYCHRTFTGAARRPGSTLNPQWARLLTRQVRHHPECALERAADEASQRSVRK